jgi:hypothetical protein
MRGAGNGGHRPSPVMSRYFGTTSRFWMNMQSKLCTQALHAPEVSGVGAGHPVRPAGGRSGVVLVSPPSGRAGPLHRLEPRGTAAEPSSNCLQHALSDSAWVKVPHLASHVLGRMAARISADWEARYAHPIYLPETFVDRSDSVGLVIWRPTGRCWGRPPDVAKTIKLTGRTVPSRLG